VTAVAFCIGAASASAREKYEPWGGPNGGDGGRGGDVILLGDVNTNNLVDYKYQPHWRGERGEHGLGSDCTAATASPASSSCRSAPS
jgi:GTP-binding protein